MKTQSKNLPEWNEEETQNVVGVFELLLKVDKRIHPENYTKQEKPNDPTSRV